MTTHSLRRYAATAAVIGLVGAGAAAAAGNEWTRGVTWNAAGQTWSADSDGFEIGSTDDGFEIGSTDGFEIG